MDDLDLEYKEHRRAIVNKCQRRRREIAKQNGICICCVKRPARIGYTTCGECSAKIVESNRRRNAARKNREPD